MIEISLRCCVWGWMMFDWVLQLFYMLLLIFIFGFYFVVVVIEFYMFGGMEEILVDV